MHERIKEIRKYLNLTQQGFADKLGVARNNIAGYETGKRSPSDAVISLICTKFGVNEDWLRTGAGDMFLPDPDNELDAFARKYNVTGLERIFLEKYLKLKQSERDAVVRFMLEIAEEAVDYSHGDLFSDIPDTPEELETQYPPVHPGKTG
nr:helix-turn-helix transcriptional regulator [Clostridium sp. Marseille-P7770]